MAPPEITSVGFSADILEFIRLLGRQRVRYVVVGGEAVIFHGYPRLTGDIDFFYENSQANCRRLFQVLLEFWKGRIPGIRDVDELAEHGMIIQFGRPPHRIDLMNAVDGVTFSDAWKSRVTVRLRTCGGPLRLHYIGLGPLLRNKAASGRPKDQDDAGFLRRKQR